MIEQPLYEEANVKALQGVGRLAAIAGLFLSAACAGPAAPPAATAEEARTFLTDVDATLKRVGIAAAQAGWVAQTYITEDTEAIDARETQAAIEAVARFAKEAAVRQGRGAARRAASAQPSEAVPRDGHAVRSEGSRGADEDRLASAMRPTGGASGVPTARKPESCLNIDDITKVMATSRNEAELRRVWEGWHTISPPMRKDYARFVELSNKGAKELGFADTGAMWRAKYDMPPDEFTKELDRLWEQVRPLYLQLHAYVRMKLREKYGDVVPANGPIPAHLLGNIWAQDWSNVYDLVAPGAADAGFSLTDILKRAQDERRSTWCGPASAFTRRSGFEPLPQDLLGALAVRAAARSRGRLPRERLGHRPRGRRAHQDVHPADRGGLHHDPSRAGPQLLPARLQGPAGALPRQRQRRLPRGDRRHDRAVGHARVPGEDRAARQGAGRRRAISACCWAGRSRRSRSCRSGC